MRGVGGPLLCIGDLLTDIGEGDDGEGAEKSSASTSTSIVPNPKDARSAIDLNHVIEIDQIFESSWTLPKYKSHSNSLERQNENKRSSQSSTVNVSDIVMDVGVSCAKKTYFKRASTEKETCCLSPTKLDRVNSSEKNGRKDGKNVEVENCALNPMMEDEMDSEGAPSNELQPQILYLTGSGSEDVRVDCSSYFKTDKEFQNKEEVVHWAKLQGRKTGTVIVMSKSQTPSRGNAPRLYLKCERFGKYKNSGASPKCFRKTGTKKCGCPFELGTTWHRVGEKEWKCKVHVRNGIHNHHLGKFMEGHSRAGRLTKEELGIVADLTKAGVKPRDIIQTLRKNDPENCTTMPQLYNAINTIKSKGMCGKSHRKHLPKELNDNMSVGYSRNLEDVMDVGDGEAGKITNETTLPDDEICCASPPKVDGGNSTKEEGREDVENVDVENCILDLTTEDEVIPLKEDDCIPPKEQQSQTTQILQQSQTTQILQSYRKGREYDENVDVENCVPDTQMEDEVISTNIEEVTEVEGNGEHSRTSQTTQVPQSFPKGRGDVENCVLDKPMEDGSVDCSSQFKTDKEFRTKEEVLHWAKLQGRQTGTVLMISKSQGPYQGRTPRLYLKCDRGGEYRTRRDVKHLRKTGTKKCACPFELGTTWSRVDEKEWKIKVHVRNGFHNHQLEKFKEGYSYAGKLTQEELDIVAVLAKAGVKPSEIMGALRKNDPGNCTSRKQLYNTIRAIRSKGKLQAVE